MIEGCDDDKCLQLHSALDWAFTEIECGNKTKWLSYTLANALKVCCKEAKFASPLLWIGLYVTAASLLLALLMFHDLIHGLRRRKHWFPCKWFPLNAATLTILAIATKLPVDLNTPMPGQDDQLSKLSGTILICVVMANFMPSLGTMNGSGVVSNVVALGILVLTVIVNICIQMKTDVIFFLLVEHIIAMAFMLFLFALLAASALSVVTTKDLLESEFQSKYNDVPEDCKLQREDGQYDAKNLEEVVKRYWLMAHTSSPQHVVGRLATCVASGAFSFLGAMVMIEAYVRVFYSTSEFCASESCGYSINWSNYEESDYKWSTTLILWSQLLSILVGTVGPAYRWFSAIRYRSMESHQWRWAKELTVEVYWTKQLTDWKDGPLHFDHTASKRWRKGEYVVKVFILESLVKLQKMVVLLSKLVRLLSILPLSCCLSGRKRNLAAPESLGKYVLHLEGEEDLVDVITRRERKDVKKWMEKGKKKKPAELIELIKENAQGQERGFGGVAKIFDPGVPSLLPQGEDEPHNCWAMPIVTLVAIGMAIPGVRKEDKERLLKAVYPGLKYVKFIEKHLDSKGLTYAREAAEILWKAIEMKNKWFDKDLVASNASTKENLQRLAKIGHMEFNEFWEKEQRKEIKSDYHDWPGEAMASYSLYKIASTIIENTQHVEALEHIPDADLFLQIREMIADTINACLANMPHAIHEHCIRSKIEDREESTRNAAFLLGEVTENILPILSKQKNEMPDLTVHRRPYIDEWIKEIDARSRQT